MTKTPIAVLGIDLGKNSCSLAGLDATGAVVMRRKMIREGLLAFAAVLVMVLLLVYLGLLLKHLLALRKKAVN